MALCKACIWPNLYSVTWIASWTHGLSSAKGTSLHVDLHKPWITCKPTTMWLWYPLLFLFSIKHGWMKQSKVAKSVVMHYALNCWQHLPCDWMCSLCNPRIEQMYQNPLIVPQEVDPWFAQCTPWLYKSMLCTQQSISYCRSKNVNIKTKRFWQLINCYGNLILCFCGGERDD